MTQHNCRPCQGIQALTPLPVRNATGQKSLSYRVGAYSEFFESMLATLSRGDAGTADRQNLPLRLLTARDKDDPSIAMLDAWAVLADVLTFYNERYINEAFLKTAKQPASLHELANLVGYTPRPGLSSAVYLAFEVDERSSEVTIPAGTPAKSTPVPGSGRSSETFETSADFVGRPSFNNMRPRLTRPQQLSAGYWPSLERIYLKGTGLRISPNDYLTITTSETDTPQPFRVLRVEEKNAASDRYTVVHLGEHSLMPQRLIRDVQVHLRKFVTLPELSALLNVEFVSELKDSSKSLLLKPLRDLNGKSLEAVDRGCDEILLKEMLHSEQPLQRLLRSLTHKLNGISTWLDTDSKLASAAAEFAQSHDSGKVKAWQDATIGIATDTDAKLAARQMLAFFKLSGVADHDFNVAVEPTKVHDTAHNRLFHGNIEFTNFPSVNTVTLEVTSTAGLEIEKGATDPGGIGEAKVRNAFSAWKVNNWTAEDRKLVYWELTITGDLNVTRYGVTAVGNGATASHFFGELEHDRLVIGQRQGNEYKIDPHIQVVGDTSLHEYRVHVEVLQQPQGVTASPARTYTGHGSGLNRAVSDILLAQLVDATLDGVYVVKYTVEDDTGIVAYALRTVVIKADIQAIPVHIANRVADELDRFQRLTGHQALTELKQGIDHALAICDEIALNPNAASVLAKSEQILKEVRQDLVGSSEPAFFEAIDRLFKDQVSSLVAPAECNPNVVTQFDALNGQLQKAEPLTTLGVLRTANAPRVQNYVSECKKIHNIVLSYASRFAGLVQDLERTSMMVLNELHKRRDYVYQRLNQVFLDEKYQLKLVTGAEEFVLHCETSLDAIRNLVADLSPKDPNARWLKLRATTFGLYQMRSEVVRLDPDTKSPWGNIVKLFSSAPEPAGAPSDDSFDRILREALRSASSGSSTEVIAQLLQKNASLWPQTLAALDPRIRAQLLLGFQAFRNAAQPESQVWIFRSSANLFGWNSPGRQVVIPKEPSQRIHTVLTTDDVASLPPQVADGYREGPSRLFLDGRFSKTVAASPIAIRHPTKGLTVYRVGDVAMEPRTRYELSGDCTRVALAEPQAWWKPEVDLDGGGAATTPDDRPSTAKDGFFVIQNAKVLCDAEALELHPEIIADGEPFIIPAADAPSTVLLLDVFNPDLMVDATVIVSGLVASKDDIESLDPQNRTPSSTETVSEVTRILRVTHRYDDKLFDDPFRTEIEVSPPLRSVYWRTSLSIKANVVEATHGETVGETLGSGDARQPFQKFSLSQAPLTRLPAANWQGKQEALRVSVNSTAWDQVEHLVHSGLRDEVFELRGNRRDAGTIVQFGNGEHGVRLPTGVENIKTLYRAGLGTVGNIPPGQINQLPSPPFGVKTVTNPLPGDGGADPDTLAQTRVRIPALPASMGRLVSKRDYENFALLFAGIDKVAVEQSGGQLFLYVAGNAPAPLADRGQLLSNLRQAIEQMGEQGVAVDVKPHKGLLLRIKALVSVDARHEWEPVKRAIGEALVSRFGYPNAQLGQPVLASDVVETIQQVRKVNYVVLDELLGLMSGEKQDGDGASRRSYSGKEDDDKKNVKNTRVEVFPNEVCYIDTLVSSTVQLERIT